MIERKGKNVALLTTRGFRDVLIIGREKRYQVYDLQIEPPAPLIPRRLIREVPERILSDGSILLPLDEAETRRVVRALAAQGITTIAVCFLHSYVNPVHEERVAQIITEEAPDIAVTTSHEVSPTFREYERTSTTVVNAYLLPIMRRYLEALTAGLARIGIAAPLLVIASNGGVVSARAAARRPVFCVGSGPAAGVAGAARLGTVAGARDLIAFDMGGTTAKASLVERGRVSLTSEYEFREGMSTPSRFIKAGGYKIGRASCRERV